MSFYSYLICLAVILPFLYPLGNLLIAYMPRLFDASFPGRVTGDMIRDLAIHSRELLTQWAEYQSAYVTNSNVATLVVNSNQELAFGIILANVNYYLENLKVSLSEIPLGPDDSFAIVTLGIQILFVLEPILIGMADNITTNFPDRLDLALQVSNVHQVLILMLKEFVMEMADRQLDFALERYPGVTIDYAIELNRVTFMEIFEFREFLTVSQSLHLIDYFAEAMEILRAEHQPDVDVGN